MRLPNKKTFIGLSMFVTILLGCGEQRNNQDSEALRQEIANREPKKVSDADIIGSAYTRGTIIADSAQKMIFTALQNQLQENEINEALKFCNINAYAITDSLSIELDAVIKRVTNKPRNPSNAPSELEALLLDSYLYNVENDLPLEDNVQKIDQDYLLYTKPIVIDNALCLKCHGIPAKDISEENYAQIQALYPQDKATGYSLGEFRGIWSIKLSKKELVKAL